MDCDWHISTPVPLRGLEDLAFSFPLFTMSNCTSRSHLRFSNCWKTRHFATTATDHHRTRTMASAANCPPGINANEYLAFQTVASGKNRRWLAILTELGSSNLNFSNEAHSNIVTSGCPTMRSFRRKRRSTSSDSFNLQRRGLWREIGRPAVAALGHLVDKLERNSSHGDHHNACIEVD